MTHPRPHPAGHHPAGRRPVFIRAATLGALTAGALLLLAAPALAEPVVHAQHTVVLAQEGGIGPDAALHRTRPWPGTSLTG